MLTRSVRWIALACLAACGNDDGSSPGSGSGDPQVIFTESFNLGWPGPAWNLVKGPYTLDQSAGSSPPSLFFEWDPSNCCPNAFTNQTFNTARATFRVDMQLDPGTSGNELQFVVRDINNATNVASVQVTDYFVTYRIHVGSTPYVSANEPMSTGFHTYTFVIESNGTASLYRDGFLKVSRPDFPTNTHARIELVATRQGHFDNVVVTVP